MKDKLLQIRVDDDFLSKLEYLQEINGYKSAAETVRKIVGKEYKKETDEKVAELKELSESFQKLLDSCKKQNQTLKSFNSRLNSFSPESN